MSTMVYSGYTLEELMAAGHGGILSLVDVLVDGRYEQELRHTGLRWRGFENQRILFLSDRYAGYWVDDGQEIEILLDADGGQEIYGYPEDWLIKV